MRVLLRHLHKDWVGIITLTICVSCPLQSHDPWFDVLQGYEDTSQGWAHNKETAGHGMVTTIRVIFTFMLRCWMFGALWVGLSPPSLYSHISTQHQGMGEHNNTSPQQHATADPRNGPSRLRKHVERCHSNILRNTHIQRVPHVPLTLSEEVFYQNKCSTNKSYHSFKLISFLCSCLNGSLGRIWNSNYNQIWIFISHPHHLNQMSSGIVCVYYYYSVRGVGTVGRL